MDEENPKPPSPSQLSKIPSWISLGFVLGALFVWALPSPETETPEPATQGPPTEPAPPAVRSGPAPLSDIEVVFSQWGQHAIWSHDLSEVALWDTETKSFSRYYEVLRTGENYYFRTIDRLTRPILTHGVKVDGPLLYTETEAMRAEWLQEKRQENWNMIRESNPLLVTPPIVPLDPTLVPPTPRVDAWKRDTSRVTTGDGR
jgi:hypothetical protein